MSDHILAFGLALAVVTGAMYHLEVRKLDIMEKHGCAVIPVRK